MDSKDISNIDYHLHFVRLKPHIFFMFKLSANDINTNIYNSSVQWKFCQEKEILSSNLPQKCATRRNIQTESNRKTCTKTSFVLAY